LQQFLPKSSSGKILKDEELTLARLFYSINSGDVRMVQRGDCPRLLPEARYLVLGIDHLRWKKFECDKPIEIGVPGEIDNAHPAFAQLLDDFVMRYLSASHSALQRASAFIK
jgi:hypothetical protein